MPASDCFTGGVAYETDILDDFAAQRRGPSYPDVVVEMGMLVEDRASHFCGDRGPLERRRA